MNKLSLLLLSLLIIIPSSAQWTRINTPCRTPDVKYTFYHKAGYWFTITSNFELMRSSDEGVDWERIYVFANEYEPSNSKIKISKSGTIFLPTDSGILRSTDLGTSWQKKEIFYGSTQDIMLDSLDNIYICEYHGVPGYSNSVWRSSDDGISWESKGNGLNGEGLVALERDNSNNFYALTWKCKLFFSSNLGQSWSLKNEITGSAEDMVIDSIDNIFLLGNHLMKSTDHGTTWIQISNKLTFSILISDGTVFLINYISNFFDYSTDGGSSWKTVSFNYRLNDLYVRNGVKYASTEKGLLYSTDMVNWILSYKYEDKFINTNDFLFINGKMYLATDYGLLFSDNVGKTWDSTIIINKVSQIKKDKFNNIFINTGKLYRSTDDGVNWELSCGSQYSICDFSINDSNYIAAVTTKEDVYSNYSKMYSSYDQGNTWTNFANISSFPTGIGRIWFVALANNGNLFFSSYLLDLSGMTADYISKISIRTGIWTRIRNDLPCYSINIYNDTLYFAGHSYGSPLSKGIFASADSGINITPLVTGLGNRNMLTVLKIGPSTLLALGYDRYPFYSINNGALWNQFSFIGLTGAINKLVYTEREIYACGTDGLFKYTGILTGGEQDNPVNISAYNLEQNYPNPFNPSTEIKYSIPKGGNVTLEVYDILGRKVSDLVNEYKNSGSYAVNFNASALSSGVYFYRLKVNNFISAKKMLIMK